MPFAVSAFQRLLEPLDRRVLNRVVASHNGNHGVGAGPQAWTCQRHLKALLFAQLSGLGSLREIEQALGAQPAALYYLDLRIPRRSTLSDAQSHRPVEVFRDICQHVMGQAQRKVRRDGEALIQLLDASPILLRDERFAFAQSDARVRGLKLHIGYDPRAQVIDWAQITSPKISDIAAARTIDIVPGAVYVYDKGYTDYAFWHKIHETGAVFVSRLKRNVHRRNIVSSQTIDDGILVDQTLNIGHASPRGGAYNLLRDVTLREVVIPRDGKSPLRLITNDLARPASEIAALYKERWQIELLFKWIKQNLKIKRFIGRSENAVKIQIYVALIAFLLLRMFQKSCAGEYAGRTKALLARLKTALLAPFDLTNTAKPPPRQPAQLPPNPQLKLNLVLA